MEPDSFKTKKTIIVKKSYDMFEREQIWKAFRSEYQKHGQGRDSFESKVGSVIARAMTGDNFAVVYPDSSPYAPPKGGVSSKTLYDLYRNTGRTIGSRGQLNLDGSNRTFGYIHLFLSLLYPERDALKNSVRQMSFFKHVFEDMQSPPRFICPTKLARNSLRVVWASGIEEASHQYCILKSPGIIEGFVRKKNDETGDFHIVFVETDSVTECKAVYFFGTFVDRLMQSGADANDILTQGIDEGIDYMVGGATAINAEDANWEERFLNEFAISADEFLLIEKYNSPNFDVILNLDNIYFGKQFYIKISGTFEGVDKGSLSDDSAHRFVRDHSRLVEVLGETPEEPLVFVPYFSIRNLVKITLKKDQEKMPAIVFPNQEKTNKILKKIAHMI